VLTARHTRSLFHPGAAKVYWPLGHAPECRLQSRFELAVGAACSYSLDWHTVAGWQLVPLSVEEKVDPETHGEHWRSATAVPTCVMPELMGQVRHGVQVASPGLAENWPLVQAAHTRSLLAVGKAAVYVPAEQVLRTVPHTVASSVFEKVQPTRHASHTRLDHPDPAVDAPRPMEQVRHGVHVLLPARSVNVPAAHVAHTKSLEAVAAVLVYWPVGHGSRTLRQAMLQVWPSPSENVEPTTQGAH